jgi:hypothetical protein
MKKLPLFVLFIFLNSQFYGQTIAGIVMSASDDKPLIYASAGVIGTSFGTITNEDGNFKLEVKGLPINSPVRFSMIGFKSQTYTIEELSNKENLLRLESETYKLSEVIVKPSGKLKKLGITDYSFKGGFCGWAMDGFGKGHEIGTQIELGVLPVKLISLNIRIYKQSYDSSLFRLHIRNIEKKLPYNEMLNKDILILITKESGWIEIDLNKYNLVFEGEIALSLEWIKVIGVDTHKLITAKGIKQQFPGVTFTIKRKEACLFTKWGSEAMWTRHEDRSPSIYLTVQ